MDPDSGAKPPNGGASAARSEVGKPPRRRKGKRGGKNRNASAPNHASPVHETGQAARPDITSQDQPARKRKRRRSRSGARSGDVASANLSGSGPANGNAQGHGKGEARAAQGGGASHAAGGNALAHGHNEQSPSQPSGSKGRNRRKKNRTGRGLQGRPLVHGRDGHGRDGQGRDGQGRDPQSKGSAKAGSARAALSGVSQPALARAMPGAGQERGTADLAVLPAGESGFTHHDDLYAALDLGTNNCRLLIAQPTRPGHFRVVDAFSRIVRLGEGLAATSRLSNEAMDRAVEALRICASKLATKPIRRMRLIATEACRAAENGEEFLARVTAETGLDLEIIDRETEARLAVSGCSSLVGREARSIVLFDIGGGSSEIAVIRIGDNRSSRLANHITHWTSLPVGVVTLSERYGGRDVTPDIFEAMVSEVAGMLSKFDCPPIVQSSRRNADHDFHLIGTSGTVTTLAGVHLDLPRYDRRRVDGLWLSDDEVSAMQAKLLSWDFAGRAANPCIGPDRADLVLAGCAILEAIRRRWPSPRMRVADRGLREGLLTDMMADDGVWRRSRPRRSGAVSPEEVLRRR
ncbi:Ppx/GppA phosphatase family protein [Neorhizobium sp. NCHU2750]|uniref:Ppx/GppA phosphatase family protein n=1 Tax=Neorhizobium sp. NCHU2750 TaxID=1825976 RepID=UPI000E706ED6|nr:exopolyphosphatase [Neorhizobium sp. NCHU2750]